MGQTASRVCTAGATVLVIALLIVSIIHQIGQQALAKSLPNVNNYAKWGNIQGCDYQIFIDNTSKIHAQNCNTGTDEYSGTDAATVIQQAINQLTSGGKIVFGVGNYSITKSLTTVNDLTLEGMGKDVSVLRWNSTASGNMMTLSTYSLTLRDLTFDGHNIRGTN